MMQEAIRALETGGLAEVGLAAFVAAFALVVLYALTLSKQKREDAKRLPFDEGEEAHPRHAAHGAHA